MRNTCFLCGTETQCDTHHLLGGVRRKKADRLGLTVPLCRSCHSYLHAHPAQHEWMKVRAQKKAMQEQGWTIEDFIREFGKSYL